MSDDTFDSIAVRLLGIANLPAKQRNQEYCIIHEIVHGVSA